MKSTHYITLDLHDMISPVVVNVKQTDTARWLEITLSEDGRAVEIPEGTTGTISFVWQGSSGVYGVPTISGNKILYKLPSEVTASPGRKHAEIALRKMVNNEIEEQLYTASFDVLVYGVTVANAQASDDSYEALDELLGQASAFLANKLITDVSYDAATDVLTISLVDGNGNESTKTLTGLKGAKGDTGVGVSRVDRTAVTGGTQITIYLDNGDYTRFTVLDGVDGAPGAPGASGQDGQDGVGVASVDSTAVTGGHLITITLTNGETETFTVYDGQDGQDGQDGSLPTYTLEWHEGQDAGGTIHPTPEEIAANTEVLSTIKNLPAGSFLLFLDVGSKKIPSVYVNGAFAEFIYWADSPGMKYIIGLMGSGNVYRQSASAYPETVFDDISYDPASMIAIAEYIDTRIGTTGNIDLSDYATTSDLAGKISSSAKGAANGVAELDSSGKVPSAQLPAYVDDALEYASQSAFPATGETGKIYVALDNNKTYRWSGSAYVEISPSLALGTTSSTAYRGDRGKKAYDHSTSGTSGGHHTITTVDNEVTAIDDIPIKDTNTEYTAGYGISISASGEISVTFPNGNNISYGGN